MKFLILTFGLCAVVTVSALIFFEREPPILVTHELNPEGDGRFYAPELVDHAIWTVNCTRPMRDCRARTEYVHVRVEDGKPRMSLFLNAGQSAYLTIGNTKESLSIASLSDIQISMIAALSSPNAKLVVENSNEAGRNISFVGLEQIIAYLTWLEGDIARASRDARLWHFDGGERAPINETTVLRIANVERAAARRLEPPDFGDVSLVNIP